MTPPVFIYGTAWKEGRTAILVEMALRLGFRAIDTANQRKHYFEEGAGEGLSAAYRDGIVSRGDLFLQTKFTYQRGQDHRLPYDAAAPLADQVRQSVASSLEHLKTDYVDSYMLHGPASEYGWSKADTEVWEAMRAERDAGRTRVLGVSNVSLEHLEEMKAGGMQLPRFVQNRCFARLGWDREVRAFCTEHQIVYQGFSLLTANQEVLNHASFIEVAAKLSVTPAQVVFSFARSIGILPLTGSTNPEHLREDLVSLQIQLPAELIQAIESIAG